MWIDYYIQIFLLNAVIWIFIFSGDSSVVMEIVVHFGELFLPGLWIYSRHDATAIISCQSRRHLFNPMRFAVFLASWNYFLVMQPTEDTTASRVFLPNVTWTTHLPPSKKVLNWFSPTPPQLCKRVFLHFVLEVKQSGNYMLSSKLDS